MEEPERPAEEPERPAEERERQPETPEVDEALDGPSESPDPPQQLAAVSLTASPFLRTRLILIPTLRKTWSPW